MSLIFERGGKESKSPTTSSTKEHTLFSYPGNYCMYGEENFDVGGQFTFKDIHDKVIFSVCGGDPFNGIPPKNVSKDDLLHAYVITISGSGSIILQISHQPSAITDPLETKTIENLSLNKAMGIRVIGIYLDSQNCRNLYVLFANEEDKWKVAAAFIDRGQYIPLVQERINGAFKSLPPYSAYPYGDNNAITDIHTYGSAVASDTWCRQINIKKQLVNIDGLNLDIPQAQNVVQVRPSLNPLEEELVNKLIKNEKKTIECVLCGNNLGVSVSKTPIKNSLCQECHGRLDSIIRKSRKH